MKRMTTYTAKNKIFLLAVVVTIISACSTDSDDITSQLQDPEPAGATTIIEAMPENSNVPIQRFSAFWAVLPAEPSQTMSLFAVPSMPCDATQNTPR